MSTFKNPVGPQSPRVYWRRRLLLAIGVIAVIIIIVLIVSRSSGAAPGAVGGHTSSPTVPAKAGTGASKTESSALCAPAKIKLVAVTDKSTYAASEMPMISMTITNIGSTPCSLNVGTSQQDLVITSGTEKIWDSKDCQTTPADNLQVFQPGVTVPTTPFPWGRNRSTAGACSATPVPVTANGASYHLTVNVGSIVSKTTAQFVLS